MSVSLDWLLLGEGTPNRPRLPPSAPPSDHLRAEVKAHLRRTLGASDAALEVAVPEGQHLYDALLKDCTSRLELTRAVVAVGSVRHLIGAPRRSRYGKLVR